MLAKVKQSARPCVALEYRNGTPVSSRTPPCRPPRPAAAQTGGRHHGRGHGHHRWRIRLPAVPKCGTLSDMDAPPPPSDREVSTLAPAMPRSAVATATTSAATSEGEGEANRAAGQLERFARGDRTAFDELVAEHQQAAYIAAWRILGDGEAAHDVVQEAFVRVLRHHQRYDAGKPFRSWLLSIVRNLAIDSLRRRRRFDHPDTLSQLSAPASPATMEEQELRERVALVLAELPEKYRSIIVMREMEGAGAEDIARSIGVDYSTTRWRLHQARLLFRQAWIARFGKEA
jgi:RNA polymerase sigma-70 factor (ECF subfamily)